MHVDKSPSQEAAYQHLAQRFKSLGSGGGPRGPGSDNHLTVISDGRMAAIDHRLFPDAPNHMPPLGNELEQTKLEQLIENVYAIWDGTHDHPFFDTADGGGYEAEPSARGQATQIVFASIGYSRGEGRLFLPDYFRAELVDRGVPSEQIAWIGDHRTQDKKRRLFNDMNDGKVTILLGSEEAMGTGVNVQRRNYVAHNLGPGWFPSMDEQRVGRTLRQGNMNPQVRIIDYSTRASYDSNMWQLMSAKAGFIEAFFRGDPSMKHMEDVGDQSTYALAAAMTTRDPRALELANMRRALNQAERAREAADDRNWNRRSAHLRLTEGIGEHRARLNKWRNAMAQHVSTAGDAFRMTVGADVYDNRTEAGEALLSLLRRDPSSSGARGEVGGFAIHQRGQESSVRAWVEIQDDTGFPLISREVNGAETGAGIVSSIEAHLRRLPETERSIEASIARDEAALASLDEGTADEAPTRDEIDQMRAQVDELEAEITRQPDEVEAEEEAEAQPEVEMPQLNVWARQLVDKFGTDTITGTGYVLRDGSLATAPPNHEPDVAIRAADVAFIDTRAGRVHAGGPLSEWQISAIIEQMRDLSPVRLIHTVNGQEQLNVETDGPLTPETLRTAYPADSPDVLKQGKRGATWFNKEGKAMVALADSADFDTLMHEFAHVFRRQMSGDQEEAVASWAGARRTEEGWRWDRVAEERFADGFVDWLREGTSPNDAVKTVFARIRTWLRKLYATVRSKLNPEVRRTFEDLLVLNDYPEIEAFERVRNDLDGMGTEGMFIDGGRRLRVRRAGSGYMVDAHDADGHQVFERRHGDADDAARDIAGVPTIETPMPAGNRRMRVERVDERAAREREAGLRVESDELALREVVQAGGESDEEVLYQSGDLREQRLGNLARGRKTQVLNRLRELGVAPGDPTPWSSKPARELPVEQLRQIEGQLLEARREGRELEARRYERRDIVRFGRQRVRQIQAEMQRTLRETKTIPEPLRGMLRSLLGDLDLRRRGVTTEARVDPGQSDPLRLKSMLALLHADFDPDDTPAGLLLPAEADKPLADMTLLELERLNNTVQHYMHRVRELQGELRKGQRRRADQVANAAARELRQAPPVRSTLLRRGLVALAGERPGFLLERMGGRGRRSAIYDTLYRSVAEGARNKRRLVQTSAAQYFRDLAAAGFDMKARQLDKWLRTPMEVPEWASEMHRWTRGELMSVALMWRDPYSRRNLLDQDAGGIVFSDRGQQSEDPVTLTSEQAMELIGSLGDAEFRFIDRPVRNLFDSLFQRINTVFREKYGYDLEQSPEYFPVEVASAAVPDNPEAGGAVDHFRAQDGQGTAEPHQGIVQFRTGAIKPMVLRPVSTVINRSLDRATTYAGLELPLTDARRLMARRQVTSLMRERFGVDTPRHLQRYLRDVAGHGEVQDGAERVLMAIKRNVSVGSLGANIKVAASQTLSLPLYWIHVPMRYIVEAVGTMADPRRAKKVLQLHSQMDPDFAERSNYGFDPDIEAGRMFGTRALLPRESTPLRRVQEPVMNALMYGVRRADRWTVGRGQQAAVLHALDVFEGNASMTRDMAVELGVTADEAATMGPEQRLALAYQWANFVTGRTQPSFLAEHMNAFARGRFTRYAASFSGYTNIAFNALRRAVGAARGAQFQDPQLNAEALRAVVTIMVVGPVGVASLNYVRKLMRGEEPDPIWCDILSGMSAVVYGLRDVAYWATCNRGRGLGLDNPTQGAIEAVIQSTTSLPAALQSGDDERITRAMERTVAAGARTIGLPYWTPKGWVSTAANLVEMID